MQFPSPNVGLPMLKELDLVALCPVKQCPQYGVRHTCVHSEAVWTAPWHLARAVKKQASRPFEVIAQMASMAPIDHGPSHGSYLVASLRDGLSRRATSSRQAEHST